MLPPARPSGLWLSGEASPGRRIVCGSLLGKNPEFGKRAVLGTRNIDIYRQRFVPVGFWLSGKDNAVLAVKMCFRNCKAEKAACEATLW